MPEKELTTGKPRFKPQTRDLTGMQFGRLTVIEFVGYKPIGKRQTTTAFWLCHCDCGNMTTVVARSLMTRQTNSCGCSGQEQRKLFGSRRATHRMSRTREFGVWCNILQRCHNPNSKAYKHYGGRGIKICSFLQESFSNFVVIMGRRPRAKDTVDRIDNNGHYSCGQCNECSNHGWACNLRWVPQAVQTRNKRTNRLLTHKGQTMGLADWSKEKGIAIETLRHRLRQEWVIERVLETPVDSTYSNRKVIVTFNERTMASEEWARETGIPSKTITDRLRRGWTAERALTEIPKHRVLP